MTADVSARLPHEASPVTREPSTQPQTSAAKQSNGPQVPLKAENKYQYLFQLANDALILHDLQGRILEVNHQAEELFGYTPEELTSLRILDLNPAHSRHLSRRAGHLVRQKGSHRFTLDLRRKSGEVFPAEVSATLFHLGDQELVQGHIREISNRLQTQVQLQQAANHDPLTGLPNRQLFRQFLETALGLARRRAGTHFALLVLDLDRFKLVNESLGHPMGDRLLIAVAQRLGECTADGHHLARISGDEFAILVNNISGVIDARQMAEKINQALAEKVVLGERELYTSAGVGIALSNPKYSNADDWLRDADTALYRAKTLGGGRQMVFDASMHRQVVENLNLETALRQAAQLDQLELRYQPIIDLSNSKIIEVEALVRWRHPKRGLIGPGEFLELAEETGDIAAIDEWVLHHGCQQLKQWCGIFSKPPSLAINVSSRQFTRMEWVLLVEEVLHRYHLPPGSLCLEVTESAMIEEPEAAIEMLSRLRKLKVRVALDDFGTGYSSLSYLHRFPVDTMKIDRSFISGGHQGSAIIEAVAFLGHKLSMTVTAEGIESRRDLLHVGSLSCDRGQGYFFSKPIHADAITAMIRKPPNWI